MSSRAEAVRLTMVAEGFLEDGRDYQTDAQAIRQRDRVDTEPGPARGPARAR